MSDLSSQTAYFRMEIVKRFAEQVQAGTGIAPEHIETLVNQGLFRLSDDEKARIVRELTSVFTITQKKGAALKGKQEPWLARRSSDINFYYWKRLRDFYIEAGILPPGVVATLDRDTNDVLDWCGNPGSENSWKRRGMVMGHVQSGKTTNYAALICKGADAGYKIVILLAGITNSLRGQTQERLDETFIGRKSVFLASAAQALPILNYAPERRFPAYGTSRERDFSLTAAQTYGISLSSLREPIIFITKKNKSTLESLGNWLAGPHEGNTIQEPLLLIDDEADNASINTAKDPKKATAINAEIRRILSLFDRSTYVGYTATPFANIFIDPDTDSSMLQDDLFPRDFIKALDPPTNYVGAHRVFDPDGDLREVMVDEIDDYGDYLPLKHKRDHPVDDLPPSLYRAIRIFVLTRAIRILRGDANAHCSMMINVSRFNDIQELVKGHVYTYAQKLSDAIRVNAGLWPDNTLDRLLTLLADDFSKEFSDTGHDFAEVAAVLPQAIATIVTETVNMRGGTLDYSGNEKDGLHVIAIGGLALSRGLTLEGLSVSYILRNTAASDTLMQMARWFGYRPLYEDICRLYLPKDSLAHYEYINEAIEEMRGEVKRMEALRMTPQDFGLRVRQSPTAIRITAANKMRSASSMTVAQNYSGRQIEGHMLANDEKINRRNRKCLEDFLSRIAESNQITDDQDRSILVASGIPGNLVHGLLLKFSFPQAHPHLGEITTGGNSLVSDYVQDRLSAELEKWDIVIPVLKTTEKFGKPVFGRKLKLRGRRQGTVANGLFRFYGQRNRVSDPDDGAIMLSEEQLQAALDSEEKGDRKYCLQLQRPVLLIHVVRTDGEFNETPEPEGEKLKLKDPVVSLSLCVPSTSVAPETRTYQVNTVYKTQMDMFASEPDDDEDYIFEGGQGD